MQTIVFFCSRQSLQYQFHGFWVVLEAQCVINAIATFINEMHHFEDMPILIEIFYQGRERLITPVGIQLLIEKKL